MIRKAGHALAWSALVSASFPHDARGQELDAQPPGVQSTTRAAAAEPEAPLPSASTEAASATVDARAALDADRKAAKEVLAKIRDAVAGLRKDKVLPEASANALNDSATAIEKELDAATDAAALARAQIRLDALKDRWLALWAQALEQQASSANASRQSRRDALAKARDRMPAAHAAQLELHLEQLGQRIAAARESTLSPSPVGLEQAQASLKGVTEALAVLERDLAHYEALTGHGFVDVLLTARCKTAFCFTNGTQEHWLGIEPIVELPVGKSFGLGRGSLADYVNNHELRVDLAAGLRVWLFQDVISVALYISTPLTDASVRVEGSSFVYPGSAIKRPYPGVALGLFYDSLWIGFDRDELHNGDADDPAALNAAFPPNDVVSSTWTITVAIQPVTAVRAAIGTAVQAGSQ